MSKIITNGYIKVKNRRVEVYWTGQLATHVMENFIDPNEPEHDFNHNDIQKSIKKAKTKDIEKFKKKKRVWLAFTQHDRGIYVTHFILTPKQAVIQTNYYASDTMEKAKKRFGIKGVKKQKFNPHNPFEYKVSQGERRDLEKLQKIAEEMGIESISPEEMEEGMEEILRKKGWILKGRPQ